MCERARVVVVGGRESERERRERGERNEERKRRVGKERKRERERLRHCVVKGRWVDT